MEISTVCAQLRIQRTSTDVLGIYLQKEDKTFQTLLYILLQGCSGNTSGGNSQW